MSSPPPFGRSLDPEYGIDSILIYRHTRGVTRVEYHPVFAEQFTALCENPDAMEIAGEVTSLLVALEDHGHDLEGEASDDPSHPVVTSRFHMFALRRTPPTTYTPYADAPPVIRIPYVWFLDPANEELAVVMLLGDKTALGNFWYPTRVNEIETRLIPGWESANHGHHARIRRTR